MPRARFYQCVRGVPNLGHIGTGSGRAHRRVHRFLDQPGLDAVKQSVDDGWWLRLNQANVSASYVKARVRDRLHRLCMRRVRAIGVRQAPFGPCRPPDGRSTRRRRNTSRFPPCSTSSSRGRFKPVLRHRAALRRVMRSPLLHSPSPLLNRTSLVEHVRLPNSGTKGVLLTGTIYKGKTRSPNLWRMNCVRNAPGGSRRPLAAESDMIQPVASAGNRHC